MLLERISSDQLLLIIAAVVIVLAFLWYFARWGSRNSDIVGLAPTTTPPATPADVEAEILALLRNGNKIEAIKRLREATGLGLKEAKDAIDALEAANAGSPAGVYTNVGRLLEDRPNAVRASVPAPAEVDSHIQSLLRSGQKIEAVKLYREVTGLGLKEAKDHVDAVERAMKH
jgi:ribosomal protein L7/L12